MKPTFVDIHVHTSENPDQLKQNYDIDALHENVSKIAKDTDTLISFSDHNVINEDAYLKAIQRFPVRLGGRGATSVR